MAGKNAAITVICVCLSLVSIAYAGMRWLLPTVKEDTQTWVEIGVIVALACVGVWSVSWVLWTKIWQRRLATHASEQARQILSESVQLIEQSKSGGSSITWMLDESRRIVENADCEFNAGRFSRFWDCIEQAAATLYEITTAIDHLKLMQREYENLAADYPHNLPSVLPGNDEIPADVSAIDSYYAAIARGLTKIDCALIWRHRQTLPAKLPGFATFGEMVQKVGESARAALSGLSTPEKIPSSPMVERFGRPGGHQG